MIAEQKLEQYKVSRESSTCSHLSDLEEEAEEDVEGEELSSNESAYLNSDSESEPERNRLGSQKRRKKSNSIPDL